MKTWAEVNNNIRSLTEEENRELDIMVELVAKIITRRNELGITQRDLAEMSGVKQSAIARLEKLNATPRLDTLLKLLSPLNLKIHFVEE